MAYRMRCKINVDWVGPGEGPMGGAAAALSGSAAGGAQTLAVFNSAGGYNIGGTGAGGILAAADITALLAAMSADLSTQLNAQPTLGQLQGFASGGA